MNDDRRPESPKINLAAGIISLVLIAWFIWLEVILGKALLQTQTFWTAKMTIGGMLVVLAASIAALLTILSTISAWLIGNYLEQGDRSLAADSPTEAMGWYLRAQRLNDRFLRSEEVRGLLLGRFEQLYIKTNDQQGLDDIRHRMKAVEQKGDFRSLEEHAVADWSIEQKPPKTPRANYVMAASFALACLISTYILMPPLDGIPIAKDVIRRLLGACLITFVVAEAMAGKAHGGTHPTVAFFKKEPYWFSIRAGCFLFFGVALIAPLERQMITDSYFGLPADKMSWIIFSVAMISSWIVCYVLGYLHKKST